MHWQAFFTFRDYANSQLWINRPVAFKRDTRDVDFDLTENPYITWKKMEEMVRKGKARNIGVSKWVHSIIGLYAGWHHRLPSFNIRRLKNLTANPLEIKPAINQVELSYWNPQPELLKVRSGSYQCEILVYFTSVVEGEWYPPWSVLSSWKCREGQGEPSDPGGEIKAIRVCSQPRSAFIQVKEIGKELGLTPAQVYISWHIQRGVSYRPHLAWAILTILLQTIVLPKSVTPSRIEENYQGLSTCQLGIGEVGSADTLWTVSILPADAVEKLERVANSHKPSRSVDPKWGVDIWNWTTARTV